MSYYILLSLKIILCTMDNIFIDETW